MLTNEQVEAIVDNNMNAVLETLCGEECNDDDRQFVGTVVGQRYAEFANPDASIDELAGICNQFAKSLGGTGWQ